MTSKRFEWLLDSEEPWTSYRTMVDLLGLPENAPQVQAKYAQMVTHPQVRGLIAEVNAWPGNALRRHNDASHLIHKLSVLADFGIRADNPDLASTIETILCHQSKEGAFQTLVNIPKVFGGTDEDQWTWILCDAPILLHFLLKTGLKSDERVQEALRHLVNLADENGYRCIAAPELGKFKGPGKRTDICPIANVFALRALAQDAELIESSAAHTVCEALLNHWQHQKDMRPFLFGIGSNFKKIKYPFIWYDILHVADVLSNFPFVIKDKRFHEMLETIQAQADPEGRYTATSMYQAWKDWSFANKKLPSPWLTFLVMHIQKKAELLSA